MALDLSNNNKIKNILFEDLSFTAEQMQADNILTWAQAEEGLEFIQAMMTKRMAAGAKKYETEVPITKQECKETNRNNLKEAYEELIDGLVYGIAQWIRITDEMKAKAKLKQIQYRVSDLEIELKRSLIHIMFACFSLMKCKIIEQKGVRNDK